MFIQMIGVFLSGILLLTPLSNAQELRGKLIDLQECTDKILGVKISCNPDWELKTDKETILMIIEEDADVSVTATITRIEEPDLTLKDLTPDYLKATGQYQSGINISRMQLSNYEALRVQSPSFNDPQSQLSDYYIIQQPFLYGVLFSVKPKEKFDQYKAIFDKMIDSFCIQK